jgi:hypothetical protein
MNSMFHIIHNSSVTHVGFSDTCHTKMKEFTNNFFFLWYDTVAFYKTVGKRSRNTFGCKINKFNIIELL